MRVTPLPHRFKLVNPRWIFCVGAGSLGKFEGNVFLRSLNKNKNKIIGLIET